MNRAGAIELLMPAVQPAELWQETGRWDKFGPQLLRIKDRHERDFVVRPDARGSDHRHRAQGNAQLQAAAGQLLPDPDQVPRRDPPALRRDARARIPDEGRVFVRRRQAPACCSLPRDVRRLRAHLHALGLQFRAVAADTGAIGGSASHEFQVLADSGEDAIAFCTGSDYAANVEKAEALAPAAPRPAPAEPHAEGADARAERPARTSPSSSGCRLRAPSSASCWTERATVPTACRLLLVRGDHMGNEVKVGKLPGLGGMALGDRSGDRRRRPAASPAISARSALRPIMPLIVDRRSAVMADFVCGANEAGFHLRGVNFGRDCREPDVVADIRNVVEGDPSPDGQGVLVIVRGIEVGHVFALGDVYSEAMGATYLDAGGKSQVMQMGCYGIGVTRVVAAAIEQNHDERASSGPPRWRRSPSR